MSLQTRRVLRRAENASDVRHNLPLFWPRGSCLAKEYVFSNALYVIFHLLIWVCVKNLADHSPFAFDL